MALDSIEEIKGVEADLRSFIANTRQDGTLQNYCNDIVLIMLALARARSKSHLPMLRRKVPDPLYRMIESVCIFRDILR